MTRTTSFQKLAWSNTWVIILIGACLFSCKKRPETMVALPDKVDFNFHIKPLLADRCFKCHGPDEKTREAGLRLDMQEGLFGKTKSGEKIISAGSPANSALVEHIFSTDPEYMMPPPESNLTLSDAERALIKKWVAQGAEWKDHWAFLPLQATPIPKINAAWLKENKQIVQNPIDNFVNARLVEENLKPSEKADPERLLRRIYLDLTGLPPSVKEMDTFLQNPDDKALHSIIDRLLESDEYAERMAMEWLDVARYADSHGYHADGWRSMYPWRDWVIKAFKENMPFDQFGTWQLAGDLLPHSTEEQILATGFNRNHQITAEGGAIDEEYRMEYVFDRINTTATAFLGLTMKCAQCHDHKFDPISQKEFFQFGAFFNNVDELGMNSDDGNCGPTLLLLSDSSKQELADIKKQIAAIQSDIATNAEEVKKKADYLRMTQKMEGTTISETGLHLPLEKITQGKNYRGNTVQMADGNAKTRLEGRPEHKQGVVGKAVCFDDEYESLFIEDAGLFDRNQPFTASAWIYPETGKGFKTIFCNSGDKNSLWRGWDFLIDTSGELIFRLIHALPHDQLRIQSNNTIEYQKWQHVAVTYDGSGQAQGMRIFLNGKLCNTKVEYNQLDRSILPVDGTFKPIPRPLRLGRWNETFSGEIAFLKGCFDDIRVFDKNLSVLQIAALASTHETSGAPPHETLLGHYLSTQDEIHLALMSQLHQLVGKETMINESAIEVQVMDEDRPRPSYVLERGVYTEKREQVAPGTPKSLGAFPVDLPQNRLGLAEWIFNKDNPLTARVVVNRYWQLFFGKGIVPTPHDFGNQGALPSHPELLDWLAAQFIEHHWDVQWLVRTIVHSAAYQRSSHPRQDLKEIDPQNILLARGPSFRMPAEMIRDNVLAASGLLVRKTGGESVKPYQPDNIWGEKSFFSPKYLVYHQDTGSNLYRRSMYTILKRTSPHPAMITMDAGDRSYCLVQRPTTNTPLQALVLLNDPTYLEAARVLAQNIVKKEPAKSPESWIHIAFRSLTGRRPIDKEIDLLEELYQKEINRFRQAPEKAKELLSIGNYPADENLDPKEIAAFTVVNNTIINHDESYMRR